jgi:hypothetical protein
MSTALALWTTEVPRPARGYTPLPVKTPLATNGEEPAPAALHPELPVGTADPAQAAPKPTPPHAPSRKVNVARDPGF